MRTVLLLVGTVLLQLATPAEANPFKALFSGGGWWSKGSGGGNGCKTVTAQKGVDLKAYTSKRWYIHEQMQTQAGNPNGRWNYCVYAEYTIKDATSVAVHNYAVEGSVDGTIHDVQLCAYVNDPTNNPGQLAVAPCQLPRFFAGPYTIVAYDEAAGFAIVSGGSPTIPTKNGLCATGTGYNNAGLWLFTRSAVRDQNLIDRMRAIAVEKGFDVDVLQRVTHEGCTYKPGATRSLRGLGV